MKTNQSNNQGCCNHCVFDNGFDFKHDNNCPCHKPEQKECEHKIGEHGAVIMVGKSRDMCVECGKEVKPDVVLRANCKGHSSQKKPCKVYTEDCYNHPKCMKTLEDKPSQDWEEEFEKKFPLVIGGVSYYPLKEYDVYFGENLSGAQAQLLRGEVKSFIQNLLAQVREEGCNKELKEASESK